MANDTEVYLDLIKSTRNKVEKNVWTDLSFAGRSYTAMRNLMKQHKQSINGGAVYQWQILTDNNGSAEAVGFWESDSLHHKDALVSATAEFRRVRGDYAYNKIYMRQNMGSDVQINNYMKQQRHMMYSHLAEKMEDYVWGPGPLASTDTVTPYSIPWWIQKTTSKGAISVTDYGTASYPMLYGLDPSGFAAGRGGVSSTTYPRWANLASNYTAISADDCIDKLVGLMYLSKIRAPEPSNQYGDEGDVSGLYTNFAVWNEIRKMAQANNDNGGRDVAWMGGKQLMVNGVNVEVIDTLVNDSSDPIYGINWTWAGFKFLEGFSFVESEPKELADNHLVLQGFIDAVYNLVFERLNNCFVLNVG